MASFDELASVTASTKRRGAIVAGLEPAYTEQIASLSCLPLDPVSPEIAMGIEGLSFREILQTATEGDLDIVEGDLLVVGSVEYPIRAVEEYEWKGSEYKILYLEDRK